jgi:hypothetical protein
MKGGKREMKKRTNKNQTFILVEREKKRKRKVTNTTVNKETKIQHP